VVKKPHPRPLSEGEGGKAFMSIVIVPSPSERARERLFTSNS